jgi:hypothetical protein
MNFNAWIKSLRATLPAEIFLPGILIFKGLTARRLYKSFGVKGLISVILYEAGCSGRAACGLSPDGIVGLNPAGGMHICQMRELCVVTYRFLRRADHSSR